MLRHLLTLVLILTLAASGVAQRMATGRTDHRLQRALTELSKGLTSVARLDFAPVDREALDGLRGYRVGVVYDRKRADGVRPARIVLLALEPSRKIGDGTKDRLPWSGIAEGQEGIGYRLGRAHGLEWFAWCQPFEAVWMQGLLDARGGQDATDMLIEGLTAAPEVADECGRMLSDRPDAVARLEGRASAAKAGEDPAPFVRGLGRVPSSEATVALVRLFGLGGPIRIAAGEALVKPHLRPAAKSAYLELLREGRFVEAIVPHVQDWGWFDALPVLRRLREDPATVEVWRVCVPVVRALEDRPLDPALEISYRRLAAADSDPIVTDATVVYEVRVVLASADREAALYHGVRLALQGEADTATRSRAAGIAILKGLPADLVERTLAPLAAETRPEEARRAWSALLARVRQS